MLICVAMWLETINLWLLAYQLWFLAVLVSEGWDATSCPRWHEHLARTLQLKLGGTMADHVLDT